MSQTHPDITFYDSEFHLQSQALHVNSHTAASLRSFFHQNLPWAMQYRSAVDEVLRNNSVQSEPAVIEFAEVSRVDDGDVLGAPSAPEIAAILYSAKRHCSSTQPIITYPKNSLTTHLVACPCILLPTNHYSSHVCLITVKVGGAKVITARTLPTNLEP